MLWGLPPARGLLDWPSSRPSLGFSYINKRRKKKIRWEKNLPGMCGTGRVSEGREAAGFGERQRGFLHQSRTVVWIPAKLRQA